jgi:hypothetical protein
VHIFWLVDGDKEGEVESCKGLLAEHGIGFEQLASHFVATRDEFGLVEEINEIGEGEEASSSGDDDDPARSGAFKFESSSSGYAEGEVDIQEHGSIEGSGDPASFVHLHHQRQILLVDSLSLLLRQQWLIHLLDQAREFGFFVF